MTYQNWLDSIFYFSTNQIQYFFLLGRKYNDHIGFKVKVLYITVHVYPENTLIQKNILLVTSKHLYNIDEKDNGRSHATVSNVHWIFVEN